MSQAITWPDYLARGVGGEGQGFFEIMPIFSREQFKLGINGDFLNRVGMRDEQVLETFTARFENPETRDIANAVPNILGVLAEHCSLPDNKIVVDFGSGTGLLLDGLSKAVTLGNVIATEISAIFVNRLREKVKAQNLHNVRIFHTKDGRDPQLQSYKGQVDLILLCDVYHHLEHPLTTMRACRAALRPETGRLVVIDFIKDKDISTPFLFEHVRATQEEFKSEILMSGFELVCEPPCTEFLKENYIMIFKPRPIDWASSPGVGWAK